MRFTGGRVTRASIYCLLSLHFMRLGRGVQAKAQILLATVSLAVREAFDPSGARERRIPIDCNGRRFWVAIGVCNDIEVLCSLLLDDPYRMDLAREPEVIVDLGSHIGASLLLFHTRYPAARLLGVEADPDTFARLRRNTEPIAAIRVRNVAVAGQNGSLPFFPSRNPWGSSLIQTETDQQPIEVPAVTLESLLDEASVTRVGLLKMNIEGGEFDVLRVFHDWERVDAILVEWHGDLISHSLAELRSILADFELDVVPSETTAGHYLVTGTRTPRH